MKENKRERGDFGEEKIKDLKAVYSGAVQAGEIGIANMIKDGIDLIEKLQKENEELKNDYENLSNSVVVKNHYIKNSIPIQKVKDNIEKEIKYHEKNILDIENVNMLKSKTAKEEAEIEFNKYAIVVLNKVLEELIEEREEK